MRWGLFFLTNPYAFVQHKKIWYICTEFDNRIREGTGVPSFYRLNFMKAQVETLLTDALAERSDLFLIDWNIDSANHIKIIIDGDEGVRVQDCIDISRAVEHNLDREALDFSIEVLSAGVTEPLVEKRQFQKNIGRILNVKFKDQEVEGELVSLSDEALTLSYQVREKKPVGKGYVKIQKEQEIAFDSVVRATVMIKF